MTPAARLQYAWTAAVAFAVVAAALVMEVAR